MLNRPSDERIEQFRLGVIGQSNENIPVAVRSIVAPRSAAEQPYRIGTQANPDLIDQRLDLCRNLKAFRRKIVHGPNIVAIFFAYHATKLGSRDRQRMAARVFAQRIEMDRFDQPGEIAFGGLPAQLLQH